MQFSAPSKAHPLIDQEYGFYHEQVFLNEIFQEQKRSVFSRKQWLLGLLNIEHVISDGDPKEVVKKIASSLLSSTREIDIKGWYQTNAIIGILVTEIGGSTPQSMNEVLTTKIKRSLQKALPQGVSDRIELCFQEGEAALKLQAENG